MFLLMQNLFMEPFILNLEESSMLSSLRGLKVLDPNDRYANHNTVFFDVSMKLASLVSTRKSH
ncbi:predicted protein [Arabidopsis lyrata subsp. lyrata]|uniref:Predicted protein n=1 Tax=Arabidopsis lyrata subsp. lyrata TaxID=81972 RepID=D7KBB4_ARALL|nr:predicted protein [Arabidopsis lyrata subsp. lyrata]